MGGCKSFDVVFVWRFLLLKVGKRTHDFAFVSLCYGRSEEEMCMGYAMAASSRMQYDYKQTNKAGICLVPSHQGLICKLISR